MEIIVLNMLIFALLFITIVVKKINTVKSSGELLLKRYSLGNYSYYILPTLIYISIITILILLFLNFNGHAAYKWSIPIAVIIFLCYFVVYPQNIYLGTSGFTKGIYTPLNSLYLGRYKKDHIKKIKIEEIKEKVTLCISYECPKKKEKDFYFIFNKNDLLKLHEWKKVMNV